MSSEMHILDAAPAAVCAATERESLPEHLVALPGSDAWALWRNVCVRAAGFPASLVLKLAAADAADAADALTSAEEELRATRAKALGVLCERFKVAEGEEAQAVDKAIKRLKKDKPADVSALTGPSRECAEEFARARERAEEARAHFRQSYQQGVLSMSRAIQEVARDARFREAVTWQNRQVIHSGIEPLLRKTPGDTRGSKQRQQEELIANYLQRYSVKNDSIGFFGPIGWGRFTPEGESLSARPGPSLLDRRNVYFESWAMDALGEKLSTNKSLRAWVAPRRFPFIHLEGTTLHVPAQPPAQIPLKQAAVLHACDGARTAKQVAALVMRVPAVGLRTESEVFRVLEQLCAMGLLTWTLEVPVGIYPERQLRRQLERVEDERLRALAFESLDELDRARAAVADAAGNPERLDSAFSELESTFTRLTDTSSTRHAGKMYAARTVVYEDCRRDIEVEVGPRVVNELGETLSLLLTSARWLTREFADTYRRVFKDIYDRLVEQTGSHVVDCMSFWQRAQPVLYGTDDYGIGERFQKRWAEILNLPPGLRRVSYESAALRQRVLEAFDAPEAGWKAARYHSPDVMIGATSAEAIRRGDYYLVLGEMHLSSNTLGASLFMEQHPAQDEFFRALEYDQPEPRIIPLPPKTWRGLTTRTSVSLISPKDIRLEVTSNSCGVETCETLNIGALVMEESDGELVVRTRDNSRRFDVMKAFGEVMLILAIDAFRMLPRAPRTPRVTIDRVVVCRESWAFGADEFAFANEKDEAARFLAARRWAREHGMPRFVFVKTPVEVKPFYVDFASPIYVDIFAKMVRRTQEHGAEGARVSVSEMLPRADETWLPDADGERYTSELRLVAVDLAR